MSHPALSSPESLLPFDEELPDHHPPRHWFLRLRELITKRLSKVLDVVPLDKADSSRFDVLAQATPLGSRHDDEFAFDPDAVQPSVVVGMVYRTDPHGWWRPCGGAAARPRDGREMLLDQAFARFRLLTGRELPMGAGAAVVGALTLALGGPAPA